MRHFIVFLLALSSVAWGNDSSKQTKDARKAGREDSSSVIYWRMGPQTNTKLVLTGSAVRKSVLIDIHSGNTLQTWNHADAVSSVAISPNGKQVLTGSWDKTAVLRDIQSGKTLQTWNHANSVSSVAFSPDGKQVLTGSWDKTAVLRDVQSGKTLETWRHDGGVSSVAFSPDGKQVLTGSWDTTVVLRDVQSGKTLKTWNHSDTVSSVAFSPDGKQVLTASWDKTAVLRDVQSGNTLQAWKPDGLVYSYVFSPDGKQVLSASDDKTASLRDVQSGKILQTWRHDGGVSSVAFSPDGKQVLTASWDKTAVLRDVQSGKTLQTWSHDTPVNSVAIFTKSPKDLVSAIAEEIFKAEADHHSLSVNFFSRQDQLEKDRPLKDEFESSAQFNQRVERWNAAVEKFNLEIKAHYSSLKTLSLAERSKAVERAISQAYGNPELRDVRYDPEAARFFATLKASFDPEFKRLISIPVPNDQARVAKAQLESDKNGVEIELRVTEQNELIWGQPSVRIGNKVVVAQFVDKDFVPRSRSTLAGDTQLKKITPPGIAPLPQTANVKIIENPSLNRLQVEVLQKELEHAALAARQAEEKRLKDRLAELNQQSQTKFNDDLPGLISRLPAAKANSRLHVLAIGINDYADVPDVPFADRSAQQFSEISQKLLGVPPQNVIILTESQATLGRMLSRINTLLNRLGPQDQLIFYYAGHGVPSKNGAGVYLLAQDGGPGSYEQPDLRLGQIYQAIADSRVGQAMIFIDACFSGRSDKDGMVFEGIGPIIVKPKQSFPYSDRIAVITAGRGDQFSNQDKARGHRLFSYHLMRLILEGGARLEVGQLHQRLRQRVLEDSRRIGPEFEQDPDFQGNGRMALLN